MAKNNTGPDSTAEKTKKRLENETRIVQMLLKCGLFLQREMNRACGQFGLNQQQFSVLNEIVWHGPISQKELVERLLFEKSNVSKIVRILQEKNLIAVSVAPGDRRMTLLSETVEGEAVWRDCMRVFHESSAKFTSDLSEEETADAILFLKKLQRAFRNQ